jgi:hypothetical protein
MLHAHGVACSGRAAVSDVSFLLFKEDGGKARQHPNPTVMGTVPVRLLGAVMMEVLDWGQSGPQIIGPVGIEALAVSAGVGAGTGDDDVVVVEGNSKDTPAASEGMFALDL